MLICEGYKMFMGWATIKPKNANLPQFREYGTWLYKPETDCWYVNDKSYPDEIVTYILED